MCRIPAGTPLKHPQSKYDPVEMYRFVKAARHLAKQSGTDIAIRDIIDAQFPQLAPELKNLARERPWPGVTVLTQSRVRLDVTCMLVRRLQCARAIEEQGRSGALNLAGNWFLRVRFVVLPCRFER